MSKLGVSYSKEMRDRAKTGKKSLFTLAVSHPGGKHAITTQGTAMDDVEAARVRDLILDHIRWRHERLEAMKNIKG